MMSTITAQRDIWQDEYRRAVSLELISRHTPPAITVSDTDGYALLPKGTIDGFEAFRGRVRRLFEQRLQDDGTIVPLARDGTKKNPKRYMQSVLCADDFVRYPELLALGLNRDVIAAVSRYIGTLPVLRTVDVFWTPPPDGSEPLGSQFFHFDHDDYRELKMFFYIEDMDEQGGPFTFFPTALSDKITSQATAFKGKRYTDEEVYRVCPAETAVKFMGPAGTGAIVDTANCLHFGGRVDHRGRLLVMHHYLRPRSNIIQHARINMSAIRGLQLDELDQAVVAVPPWASAPEAS